MVGVGSPCAAPPAPPADGLRGPRGPSRPAVLPRCEDGLMPRRSTEHAGFKQCPRCRQEFPFAEFGFQKRLKKDGTPVLRAYCELCDRAHRKLARYGLTQARYDAMKVEQHGCCAICGCWPPEDLWHIDHDHKTGKVRALLCMHCNTMLGMAQDDPAVFERAVLYLRRHSTAEPQPALRDATVSIADL